MIKKLQLSKRKILLFITAVETAQSSADKGIADAKAVADDLAALSDKSSW